MWAIYRAYAKSVNRNMIENALHDPDDVIRIEAVRAISRYKDSALVPIVHPLLGDPSWRVQEQAAETIRVLRGKPLTDHWTRIPANVHVPAPVADRLGSLPAMSRTPAGKLGAPRAEGAGPSLALEPVTAQQMTSPVPGAHPRVRIVTTKGNIYVALFPEWAPLTVANFLDLSQSRLFRPLPLVSNRSRFRRSNRRSERQRRGRRRLLDRRRRESDRAGQLRDLDGPQL